MELLFRHRRGYVEKKRLVSTTISSVPPGARSPEEGTSVCPYERLRNPKRGQEKSAVLKEGAIDCRNCAWCWGGAHAASGRREDDLDRFSMWARTDLEKRTKQMFRPFAGTVGATMGAADAPQDDCVCGAIIPCTTCSLCVACTCQCPR